MLRLVKYSGTVTDSTGKPLDGVAGVGKQEPCQKASGFVFCSMRAEEMENQNFREGAGKIYTLAQYKDI